MKHLNLSNLITSFAMLLCISCAHQTNTAAEMDEDLIQEASNEGEAEGEAKNLSTLDVQNSDLIASNDATPPSENLSSPADSSILGTDVDTADVASKNQEEVPVENKPSDTTSGLNNDLNADADASAVSMLEVDNTEKNLALEEINKVEVLPTMDVSAPMMVASEDLVNADLAANTESSNEGNAKKEKRPAKDVKRELSNESKANSDQGIETEPVPAPAKKSPKTGNESKKNRVETVDYLNDNMKKDEQSAVVVAPVEKAIALMEQNKAPLIAEEKKAEPKLASAEIADFMSQHYLAVGILALVALLIAYRLTRRSSKQDENFPL